MNRARLLKDAAAMLASQPDEQLRHLEEIGAPESLDELALQYDDIAAAANDMLLSGELSRPQYEAAVALDEFLLRMSGQDKQDLWLTERLFSASEWQEVRRLASELLKLLLQNRLT
jgi:hypothetical protein